MKESIHNKLIKQISKTGSQADYGLIYSMIGHFYYLEEADSNETHTLTMPTRLKKEGITAMTGDIVEFDREIKTIIRVIPRESELDRPRVANIDQAIILIAQSEPTADLEHLDRLLTLTKHALPKAPVICISKVDLDNNTAEYNPYRDLGYQVIEVSSHKGKGLKQLHTILDRYTSVLAGKSGVGKSSLLNRLKPDLNLKVGDLSEKTQLGMHTTRTINIFHVQNGEHDFRVLDTPGFSRLDIELLPAEISNGDLFPEIERARESSTLSCKYDDCNHIDSEECAVIWNSEQRYQSYCKIYEESLEWEKTQLENNKIKKSLDESKQKKNVSDKKIPLLNESYRSESRRSKKQSFNIDALLD